MNEEEAKRRIREALEEAADSPEDEDMDEARAAQILDSIYRHDRRRPLLILRWTAAAAILLSLIWGATLLFEPNKTISPAIAQQRQDTPPHDIAPGKNKAILKLADGKLIDLDDATPGRVADDPNTELVKAGTLSYKTTTKQEPAINTVSTPRGGQFQIRLSDGSIVWLNASSSLRFPTSFTGADRTVELTGEAYFEIAKNSKAPFLVKINSTIVEVLGTSFNINGYEDEPVLKTTLVTGAVRVKTAAAALLLKPGQQAEGLHLIPNPDLEESLAWKNGTFNFNKLGIETIMRQISRWYDVDIEYEGAKPSGHFSGIISRNTPVSTVLKLLEYGGVHCKVAAKKIVIMPN